MEHLRPADHARQIQLPDGTWTYDYTKFEPELAESWELAPDGKSVTFHLRKDATFHDGAPVTAKDVKWSFDRAVAVGGFPAIQMGAERDEVARPVRGRRRPHHPRRLPAAEQADPAQPRRADRQGGQFRARQEARHRQRTRGRSNGSARTTPAAAPTWSRAGSRGARSSSSASTTGSRDRCPIFTRVISRQIASAGTRRALLEKGDADLSFNLPPKDFARADQDRQADRHRHAGRRRAPLHRHAHHQAALRQSEGPAGGRLCHSLCRPSCTPRSSTAATACSAARATRRRPTGRSPRPTRPTSTRPRRCSPRPASRTASRRRSPTTSRPPRPASRSRSSSRTALKKIGIDVDDREDARAPTGTRGSTRRTCRCSS